MKNRCWGEDRRIEIKICVEKNTQTDQRNKEEKKQRIVFKEQVREINRKVYLNWTF